MGRLKKVKFEAKRQRYAYPPDTPVSEMTPAQQAAYWKRQNRKQEHRLKAYKGISLEEVKELRVKVQQQTDVYSNIRAIVREEIETALSGARTKGISK